MTTIKSPIQNAEQVKQYIIQRDLLESDYKIVHTKTHVYFPVKDANIILKALPFTQTSNQTNPKLEKKEMDLRKVLEFFLTEEELSALQTSYDVVGNIIIIEIPDELIPKEDIIAEQLLTMHSNITTIVKKAGEHEGEFRTQKMQHLAGIKTKETTHKESGVRVSLNVEEVYFSPRTGNERLRIAKLVKDEESVLVMFSGCGIYPLVIAKNSNPKEIVGVEKNPIAHEYAEKNLALNKIHNITLYQGDVKEVVPKLDTKFDRIVMPLPKSAEHFLDLALIIAKEQAFLHFYMFTGKKEDAAEIVEKLIGQHCNILNTVVCGQYSPKLIKVCVDIQLLPLA